MGTNLDSDLQYVICLQGEILKENLTKSFQIN